MMRFIHHNYAPNHTPLKNPRSKPIRSRNFRLTRYNDFLFFERTVFSVSSESSATIGTSKRVFRLYSFGERRSFLRPLLVSTTETNCYHSTSKPFPPQKYWLSRKSRWIFVIYTARQPRPKLPPSLAHLLLSGNSFRASHQDVRSRPMIPLCNYWCTHKSNGVLHKLWFRRLFTRGKRTRNRLNTIHSVSRYFQKYFTHFTNGLQAVFPSSTYSF